MSLSSRGALADDFDQVFLISSELGGNDGAVPSLEGRFDWIENDPTEEATLLRLEAAKWTVAACRLGGYCINEAEIPLLRLPDLIEGTQLFASKPLKGPSTWTTEFDYHLSSEISLTDVILELSKSQPVTLLLAGNAYSVGGNFTNGGLASLEEALCIQSTLHMSLRRAAKMAEDLGVEPPRWAAKDQPFQPYIPGNGVIISPFVEIFRAGPENGFAFLQTVVDLAVLTIAMPNCNPALSQPVDAPKDFSEYKQLVGDSITAGLQAAVAIKSPVLIIPEVGGGLQQNDPRVVGDIISDLLLTQFPNAFAQVNFFGDEPFLLSCSRVEQGAQDDPFGGVEAPLRQRPRSLGSDFSDELLGAHGGSASGTILDDAPNGLALSAATLLGDGGAGSRQSAHSMDLDLGLGQMQRQAQAAPVAETVNLDACAKYLEALSSCQKRMSTWTEKGLHEEWEETRRKIESTLDEHAEVVKQRQEMEESFAELEASKVHLIEELQFLRDNPPRGCTIS